MKILSYNSIKGIGKFNNDTMNIFSDFCFVMDGASAVFNDHLFYETSDLYEYMQLLKHNVSNKDEIKTNFKKGIIESNKKLANINNYKEYELPTFTIAAIKERKDTYELYLLCDCLISILYKDGLIENIEDHRFDATKKMCRQEINEFKKLNLSPEELMAKKVTSWQKCRKLANVENGYPVGSTQPNCIDQGIIKIINKKDIKNIIICTDGFYDTLGMPDNETYFIKKQLEKRIINNKNYDDLTYILISNE